MKAEIIDIGEDGIARPIVKVWQDVKECSRGKKIILSFDDVGESKAIVLGVKEKMMIGEYLLENPGENRADIIAIQYNPYNGGGFCSSYFKLRKSSEGIIWRGYQKEFGLK